MSTKGDTVKGIVLPVESAAASCHFPPLVGNIMMRAAHRGGRFTGEVASVGSLACESTNLDEAVISVAIVAVRQHLTSITEIRP